MCVCVCVWRGGLRFTSPLSYVIVVVCSHAPLISQSEAEYETMSEKAANQHSFFQHTQTVCHSTWMLSQEVENTCILFTFRNAIKVILHFLGTLPIIQLKTIYWCLMRSFAEDFREALCKSNMLIEEFSHVLFSAC